MYYSLGAGEEEAWRIKGRLRVERWNEEGKGTGPLYC